MQIAIIGTGNLGGALASGCASKGHDIRLGVQNIDHFKGESLLSHPNITVFSIHEAVQNAEVVIIATPPTAVFDIIEKMGDVSGKVIIDATNSVRQSPAPYPTVYHCLAEKTKGHIVKCFNSTGFENILNPVYEGNGIDMFMAGDSQAAKDVAAKLALDIGFGSCIDFGKADKVELLEKLALSWINLAIMQGQGRNIAFRLVHR